MAHLNHKHWIPSTEPLHRTLTENWSNRIFSFISTKAVHSKFGLEYLRFEGNSLNFTEYSTTEHISFKGDTDRNSVNFH